MPTYTQGQDEVVPEGEYSFTVKNAEEKVSKAGNPMIELQLQVDVPGKNGGIRVWDRLVFAEGMTSKIDDFRIATGETGLVKGQPATFEDSDCIDRTGKARIGIEIYQGREKNKIESYIDPAKETAEKPPKKVDPPSLEKEFGDDEIP
jgi:Protein of unknown function (DUF669)